MLTKNQLKKIEEAIRKRFLVFSYETLGKDSISDEDISELKRLGLLRGNVRNYVGDAYTLGRIARVVDREKMRDLSLAEVNKIANKMQPMTKVEQKAMEWSANHAGQYVKGIGDDIAKEIGASASRIAMDALRDIREGVKEAIVNHETTSQLRSTLYHAIKVKHKDWQRVASTEMHESIQRGIHSEIVATHGADQLVYKLPKETACKHCKRLFLGAGGIPRVFKISELADSNFGKKAVDWEPVIGAVHPWCQCQLMMIPDGYDFVKHPTTGKVRLEYTGTTAAPTTEKSFKFDMDSSDDDCTCEY